MPNPLISVIIPAYNSEEFIAESLASVFAQNYKPVETIVVDDGSNDRTAEIIKRYRTNMSDKHGPSALIYIYQKNAGPSKARNTGIQAARGEFIAFLDADDMWPPDKLEKQIKYMAINPGISMVFGDMKVFNKEGDLIESAFKRYGFPECDEKGRVLHAFEMLLERNYISTGTVLLRKICFERTGYFDETIRHAEDYDLWLRISLIFDIGCIPEIFRLKRMHDSNLSKNQIQFYLSRIYILQKIMEDHPHLLKSRCISLNKYILGAIRELSYYYYLRRQYLKALKTGVKYITTYLNPIKKQ